jgi:hypothetical protein
MNQSQGPEEEDIRRSLRQGLQTIKRREPLESTYSHFLLHHAVAKPPMFPSDPMYCRSSVLMAANLRERVEAHMKSYGVDGTSAAAGRHRPNLEEAAMRAAFTLREPKVYEQEPLIAAATAMKLTRRIPGMMNMDEATRRQRMEAMARGLQDEIYKKSISASTPIMTETHSATVTRSRQIALAKQKLWKMEEETLRRERLLVTDPAEVAKFDEQIARIQEQSKIQQKVDEEAEKEQLTMMQMQLEHQRQREVAHEEEHTRKKKKTPSIQQKEKKTTKKRKKTSMDGQETSLVANAAVDSQEVVNKSAILRLQEHMESPQQSLYRVYHPIFQALWAMEFDNLGRTNPFRIIIDKNTCASMGVPDYCTIITKPMNLTYIREKVEAKKYMSLQEFFDDIELMIENALLYNNNPTNPYHVAALQLRKRFKKLAAMATPHGVPK